MEQDATGSSSKDARRAALHAISRSYPRWQCWEGVLGLLYARIPGSSPAVVVRAVTPEELRVQVHDAEEAINARHDGYR